MMFCICSCSDVLVDLRALNGSSASEEAQNSGSVLEPITFGGTTYQNTNEVVVIAKNKTATVNMTDDSSFSSYYTNGLTSYQGVFLKGRNVQLSAFAIGQYEVTRELYTAVMTGDSDANSAPFYFTDTNNTLLDGETRRYCPAEYISWYDAVYFCNKLSEKLGYNDAYTITNIEWGTGTDNAGHITSADVSVDISKNGYRLPTEAEWEFSARGGDSSATWWGYAYAGVNSTKDTTQFLVSPYNDTALDEYGWYSYNLAGGSSTSTSTLSSTSTKGYGVHQVGMKKPNALNIYDMSGNVSEWCNDWSSSNATENDSTYTTNGVVINPLGPSTGVTRVIRGGDWAVFAYVSCVSNRCENTPSVYYLSNQFGIRVCRSLR